VDPCHKCCFSFSGGHALPLLPLSVFVAKVTLSSYEGHGHAKCAVPLAIFFFFFLSSTIRTTMWCHFSVRLSPASCEFWAGKLLGLTFLPRPLPYWRPLGANICPPSPSFNNEWPTFCPALAAVLGTFPPHACFSFEVLARRTFSWLTSCFGILRRCMRMPKRLMKIEFGRPSPSFLFFTRAGCVRSFRVYVENRTFSVSSARLATRVRRSFFSLPDSSAVPWACNRQRGALAVHRFF